MASGEETALAALIRTLNSAILAATSALIPKLPQEHASELHQASQRLQIWSNSLGIISGEIRERLRDQQELEFSIVTLHIMIAQGLVSAGTFVAMISIATLTDRNRTKHVEGERQRFGRGSC
jgi:hypothetical protein